MFCAKCGKQIPDGSAVCPFCGAPLAAPQAAAPQAAPQVAPQVAPQAVPPVAPVYAPAAAPKAKKPINKLTLIIACVAAALVLGIVLYLILHDGAKAVVKDYLNYQEDAAEQESAFLMKKSEKALEGAEFTLYSDEACTKLIKGSKFYSGKDDEFEGLCNYIEDKMKGETKKVSKMAIVEVKVKSGSGKKSDSMSMFFTCVKVSGKWYILTDPDDSSLITYMYGDNIKDVANKWAKFGSSKKSSDDDDD